MATTPPSLQKRKARKTHINQGQRKPLGLLERKEAPEFLAPDADNFFPLGSHRPPQKVTLVSLPSYAVTHLCGFPEPSTRKGTRRWALPQLQLSWVGMICLLHHPHERAGRIPSHLGTPETWNPYEVGTWRCLWLAALSQDRALLSPAHHPLRSKYRQPAAEGLWDPGHTTARSFTQHMKTHGVPKPRQAQTRPPSGQ